MAKLYLGKEAHSRLTSNQICWTLQVLMPTVLRHFISSDRVVKNKSQIQWSI